jgi:hypothetical protein
MQRVNPRLSAFISRGTHTRRSRNWTDVISSRPGTTPGAGVFFSVHVFQDELDGLIICETEAVSMEGLSRVRFPPWAIREVTEIPFFTGGFPCRAKRSQLLENIDVSTRTSIAVSPTAYGRTQGSAPMVPTNDAT